MVAYSFGINDPGFFTVAFGFHVDQFQRLLDPIYLRIYRDTFVHGVARDPAVCLLIGYPFAYFLATRAGKYKSLLFCPCDRAVLDEPADPDLLVGADPQRAGAAVRARCNAGI